MYLGTIRAERRRAVKREPHHQTAVEQCREQHGTAFVARRSDNGLNHVLEGQRILDVRAAKSLSGIAGVGGDAVGNQHARSLESSFVTPPMHDAVLPRAQSLVRASKYAELSYRKGVAATTLLCSRS